MKKLLGLIITLSLCLGISSVHAASVKVSPLKYEETLLAGESKVGAIDVSNPGDSTQTYSLVVRGFRQANQSGELEFFDDTNLQAGILLDQSNITLTAHQAARIFFSVSSDNLPKGGVYGAILVTSDANQPTSVTRITSAVQSGTLLLLNNGGTGEYNGEVTKLSANFFQLGSSINASAVYKNTNSGSGALAFSPKLLMRMLPWGNASATGGPIVFPGNERTIQVLQQGSYFGLYPLTVADSNSGLGKTSWVFAVTGYWRVLAPVLGLVIVGAAAAYYLYKLRRNQEIY